MALPVLPRDRAPAAPAEFLPPVSVLGGDAPSPLPRLVLWTVLALCAALAAWISLGRLDVVAVAEGRLVPRSQLRIVQPAEGGVLREILVAEGERVRAGQVLGRMDMRVTQADAAALETELALRELQLRRIDAELRGERLAQLGQDRADLYPQVEAQRDARVLAYENAVAEERAVIARARREMRAAQETQSKLAGALPVLIEQERAFERLANEGFAGKLMWRQRGRERLEAEQDLRAQEVEKLRHRQNLAELRAPADGVVKDLATHTPGSVLAPGAVLMTLVPEGEPLVAEVWLQNHDAGFVRSGQPAKLKLASFPFQRYGMLEGRVLRISADSTERVTGKPIGTYAYRALVEPLAQELRVGEAAHVLLPGMQLTAEIRLAERSVLEYLLSPLQKVAAEAGRER